MQHTAIYTRWCRLLRYLSGCIWMQLSRLLMNRQAGDFGFRRVGKCRNPRLASLDGDSHIRRPRSQTAAFAGCAFGRTNPGASPHLVAFLRQQARLATGPSSRATGQRPISTRDCLKLHDERQHCVGDSALLVLESSECWLLARAPDGSANCKGFTMQIAEQERAISLSALFVDRFRAARNLDEFPGRS